MCFTTPIQTSISRSPKSHYLHLGNAGNTPNLQKAINATQMLFSDGWGKARKTALFECSVEIVFAFDPQKTIKFSIRKSSRNQKAIRIAVLLRRMSLWYLSVSAALSPLPYNTSL
ncbi:MAG: hypothetical protein NC302_06210 [Bacteroidales bacterium]|nr:hypothetical protein [Bacteroidales bacterium]MCM1415872.1 hypothetical protein [bacterium]